MAGESLEEGALLAGLSVLRLWEREPHRQDVIGIKAWIDLLHLHEALDHQPRADQEDQRERHFCDDQQIAYALAMEPLARAPAFFERFVEVWFGDLQSR